ncbi:putative colanic acid biosynthesis acetyltransferase [Martelella mangrovi]|uniref:Colanic acid biosynthesis acetyltransferase WcaF n=1 Tax=Martelella mangrovi TaxID=1397477 RepID=A0ABV2I6X3_9HYPH
MKDIKNAEVDDPFKGGATFSLQHRLIRMAWGLAWCLLASWTPPQANGVRVWLLRLFGAKIHPTARVYGSAKIWYPANLEMDAYASLGPGVICYSMDRVVIGHHVVVSQRAHLCTGTHDIKHPSFQLFTKPIVIEDNAWVCAEAFVGPGVRVGEGAVLAARAAAFQELAPWTVYRGNPAEPIKARPRFEREVA